jgi:hypothetical protein
VTYETGKFTKWRPVWNIKLNLATLTDPRPLWKA